MINLTSKGLTHIPLLEGEETAKEVILKGNLISKVENLVSLPNLEKLNLSCNRINDISGLFQIKTLEMLKFLDLSNNLIDKICGFDYLPNIETLNLAENKISKIEGLENLWSLWFLNLKNNCMISTLENLPVALEDLDLTNNKVSKVENSTILSLSLKKLNLTKN